MITVPDEIKELLHQDHCQKNIRIHFPNGERSDICNDLIVKDSVSFTESLCSQNELKFGLCESPVFECEVVGVGNIKGATIEVFCEIFCSPTVSGAVFQPDIRQYVYPLPYGIFYIESCKRQADMIHRKIQAYGYKRMPDIKNDARFSPLYNTAWYTNEGLVYGDELFGLMLGENDGEKETLPLRYFSREVPYGSTPLVGKGSAICASLCVYPLSNNNFIKEYNDFFNVPSVGYTDILHAFSKFDLAFKAGFDIEKYLQECMAFYNRVKDILDNLGYLNPGNTYYKDAVEALALFKPKLYFATPAFYRVNASGEHSYDVNYFEWGDDIGQSDSVYASSYPVAPEFWTGYEYSIDNIQKSFIAWEIDKKIDNGSTQDYYWSQGAWQLYLPSNGMNFRRNRPGESGITLDTYDMTDMVSVRKKTVSYDVAPTIKTNFIVCRDIAETATRKKYTLSSGTVTSITRTEYHSNADETTVDMNDVFQSELELQAKIGYKNRNGGISKLDLQQQFGLTPSSALYPGNGVYPEGVTGGELLPDDYQSCWYEDEYVKPVGCIQIKYKNYDNEDVLYSYYMNGFNEGSDPDSYKIYDLSNNYLIKSNIFTDVEIAQIAALLATALNKVVYMPVDFVGRGLPYVEAGDTFEILTKSNDSITTIVLNRTLSGEQTLTDSYKSV